MLTGRFRLAKEGKRFIVSGLAELVLGKFSSKLVQTQFELNLNQKFLSPPRL